MDRRLQLHEILVKTAEGQKVYFQPPPNLVMEYPCVVYSRDSDWTEHAGNLPYAQAQRYTAIIIDRNPDSKLIDKFRHLPLCSFGSHYVVNGLNHDTFNIYH